MKGIATFGDEITFEDYGAKAYWLDWMQRQGICVPHSFFIPIMDREIWKLDEEKEKLRESLWGLIRRISDGKKSFAVRSSAEQEDGVWESHAGRFKTFLDVKDPEDIYRKILQVAASGEDGDRLGVIVQEMIPAAYSGIIFSSEPGRGSKSELLISAVSGRGNRLVSGIEAGEDIRVRCTANTMEIVSGQLRVEESRLSELSKLAKRMERKLKFPVDMEWCVEKETNKLYLLQCRPMTGIFARENVVVPVEKNAVEKAPFDLSDTHLIDLKELAGKYHILTPDSFFFFCNCLSEEMPEVPFNFHKSSFYSGYSIALLSPQLEEQKAPLLVGNKTAVYATAKCYRFGIRNMADYENLTACLADLYKLAYPIQWSCSFLIQELWRTRYSGMLQQTEDGGIIEISRGFFQTKGALSVNTYLLDGNGKVTYSKECRQEKYVDIIEGCILEYYNNENDVLSFSHTYIESLWDHFIGITKSILEPIEFGILEDEQMTPYLMGRFGGNRVNITAHTMERGVLSAGRITGKLVKLSDYEGWIQEHEVLEESVIFYLDKPDIQWQKLLEQYPASRMGFLFWEGALLCHLAILLRERQIPAVRGVSGSLLKEGALYRLDTGSSEVLSLME